MAYRWWKLLLVIVVAIPLLMWGFDRAQMICWVGSTDLEIEFVVTDSDTGVPVSTARIEVQSDGGFYEEKFKQQFVLATDANGAARKDCLRSMCFGTESGLRFTNTYVVHLPFWMYRVVSDGYEPSEWESLDEPEHVRRVRRVGPNKSKLLVPVLLRVRRG